MYMVEKVLGSVHDTAWKDTISLARVDVLELSQWDAQKNRLRRETQQGRSVAVSLERGSVLRDGDVLWWDEDSCTAVICRIRLCDVMVVDVQGLKFLPPGAMVERCVALGHALGNQHWPAVVQEEKIYVPLAVDKKVMDSVMRTHHIDGVRYSFIPGAQIADELAPAQVRRLFGGSEQPFGAHAHAHASGHGHTHPHGATPHEHHEHAAPSASHAAARDDAAGPSCSHDAKHKKSHAKQREERHVDGESARAGHKASPHAETSSSMHKGKARTARFAKRTSARAVAACHSRSGVHFEDEGHRPKGRHI